jgi:hypothetical protein
MKRNNPIPMELRDSMKRKSPYLCVEELNEKKNSIPTMELKN